MPLKTHSYPIIKKKVAMMLLTFHQVSPGCTDLITPAKELLFF